MLFSKGGIIVHITSKIGSILQTIIEPQKDEFQYSVNLRDYAAKESDEESKRVLELLSRTMTLGFNYNASGSENPFSALIVLSNGQRSIDSSDFMNEDFENLKNIVEDIKPLFLQSRIYDLLWTIKKDYKCAQRAIEIYLILVEETFDVENWVTCFRYIKRANTLACSLGKNNPGFTKCCSYIDNKIKEINGTDPLFLSISLIELSIENKNNDLAVYVPIVENIISDAIQKNNLHRIESAFKLKINLHKKLKDSQAEVQSYCDYAQCLEKVAEKHKEKNEIANALHLYEKVILIYRNNGQSNDEKRIRLLIEPLKQKYAENMPCYQQKIDCSSSYKFLKKLLSGRSLLEQIVILSINTTFYTKQEMEDQVVDNAQKYLFKSMMASVIMDKDGKSIARLHPLDRDNPKSDLKLLESHMHREAVTRQSLSVITFFSIALNIIKDENQNIGLDDLNFLITDNYLIPYDRKHIFKLGIMHGLNGDYYAALHLLTPQIENLFREIARMCGGLVTTFEDDTTEQAKVLSSIFDMPELLDCYDNDVLFLFKGLLNEKTGANLRNRVAHGIIDSDEGNGAIAMYFLVAVIKLCSWYSNECIKKMNLLHDEIKQIYQDEKEYSTEIEE